MKLGRIIFYARMELIKPIETCFLNTIFRSRLEARWAVFFTALEIKWEYEMEGYDLDGTWYLPDFYLPYFDGGTYVEVKPCYLNQTELSKAYKLCELTKRPVFLAVGSPQNTFYKVLFWDDHVNDEFFSNFHINWKAKRDSRFWIEASENEYEIEPDIAPELFHAVILSRSYRF